MAKSHKSKATRPVPPAVPMFRAFLVDRNISQTAFCEEKHLDRITVQKVVNGQRARINVDFALGVDAATDGEVPFWAWSTKFLAAPPSARPRRVARKASVSKAAA